MKRVLKESWLWKGKLYEPGEHDLPKDFPYEKLDGNSGMVNQGTLAEVKFASNAARELAEEVNLDASSFAEVEPSSENGYTKDDVQGVVDKIQAKQ